MTWEEKLAAMQALQGDLLRMVEPRKWVCALPGAISGGQTLRSACGSGATPELATEDAWRQIESLPRDHYLVKRGKHYRWSGFMWTEVSR